MLLNIQSMATTIAFLSLFSLPASAALEAEIEAESDKVANRVIAWRRDIHAHPELSNREFRTSELVAQHLRELGMEVSTGVAHTGVVGLLSTLR